MSKLEEPAVKSYFFGKGYRDLWNVITESWKRNRDSARDFFGRIRSGGKWWETGGSFVFWGAAGSSVVVFGSVFFFLASVLHIVFLGVLFSFIYIGFTLVWVTERIYLIVHKYFAACPICHHKATLPEYLCDSCGAVHRKLMPNSYGVFFHKCSKCGNKLPATFFVNRGRLQAKCIDCGSFLNREHVETKRIFIPVLGGPSAGKTAFMFAVVRNMIEEGAEAMGFSTEFIDENAKAEYKRVLSQLKMGREPAKTLDTMPKAFNLALRKNGRIEWLFYLYDPAGESFHNTENLLAQKYHGYISGMVLIVDPFSFADLKRLYKDRDPSGWHKLSPSQLSPDEAVSRLVLALEEAFGLAKNAQIKKPLSVVINKVDAFGLEDLIGEKAVENKSREKPNEEKARIRDGLIKKQLEAWGQHSLLQQLEVRFKNVRYFTCSALGRTPDAGEGDLIAKSVLEPVIWLCNSVNKNDFR